MAKVTKQKSIDDSEIDTIKSHPVWTAAPSEIASWVQSNVTDLASAKMLLKWLAVLVILMARRRI